MNPPWCKILPSAMTNTTDNDFWIEFVRRCGSNSATDGFASLESLVRNGDLNAKQLRLLSASLRSIAGAASDRASEQEDRVKRPYLYTAA
jgi:hypothetical protein